MPVRRHRVAVVSADPAVQEADRAEQEVRGAAADREAAVRR